MRLLSTYTMENELLSTRKMTNDVANHKNNATEAVKLENDDK